MNHYISLGAAFWKGKETPRRRYEEVDGVRKEKERLTTDHQPVVREINIK